MCRSVCLFNCVKRLCCFINTLLNDAMNYKLAFMFLIYSYVCALSLCATWLHYKGFSFSLRELQPWALSYPGACSTLSGGWLCAPVSCTQAGTLYTGTGCLLCPHHLHPLSQGWTERAGRQQPNARPTAADKHTHAHPPPSAQCSAFLLPHSC